MSDALTEPGATRPGPETRRFGVFVAVWLSQGVSVIGNSVSLFAITVWLSQSLYPRPEQKLSLSLGLTLLSITFAMASVATAPIAGVLADRYDRRRLMMLMNLCSGMIGVILLMALARGVLTLASLLGLVVLAAASAGVHRAAYKATPALLVRGDQLVRANGMIQAVNAAAAILGPIVAGFFISLPALARQGKLPDALATVLARVSDGTALAIGLDATTFFVAALVLTMLRFPRPSARTARLDPDRAGHGIWHDLGQGVKFVWAHPPLRWLLIVFTVEVLLAAPLYVLQILILKFNLAADLQARGLSFEAGFAMLQATAAIAVLLGGAMMSLWGGLRQRRAHGVLVPLIVKSFAIITIGLSRDLHLTVAATALAWLTAPISTSHVMAMWQAGTPAELQGRVLSLQDITTNVGSALSLLLGGVAGARFDAGHVAAALGGLLLVFCTSMLFNTSFVAAGRRPEPTGDPDADSARDGVSAARDRSDGATGET